MSDSRPPDSCVHPGAKEFLMFNIKENAGAIVTVAFLVGMLGFIAFRLIAGN